MNHSHQGIQFCWSVSTNVDSVIWISSIKIGRGTIQMGFFCVVWKSGRYTCKKYFLLWSDRLDLLLADKVYAVFSTDSVWVDSHLRLKDGRCLDIFYLPNTSITIGVWHSHPPIHPFLMVVMHAWCFPCQYRTVHLPHRIHWKVHQHVPGGSRKTTNDLLHQGKSWKENVLV